VDLLDLQDRLDLKEEKGIKGMMVFRALPVLQVSKALEEYRD
jgi:hypothetical protein